MKIKATNSNNALLQFLKRARLRLTAASLNVSGQFKRLRYILWRIIKIMMFNIEKDGDSLERVKISFIDEHIPNYRYLWTKFIGHDGAGNIQPSNLDQNKERKRKEIGSLNYSIMQNLMSLFKKKDKIVNFVYDQTSVDSYTELKELISEYVTLFGLIVDRQEKMLKHFVTTDNLNTYTRLSEKYKPTRNFLQHDNDVTLIVDDLGLVAIPVITSMTMPEDVNWFKEFHDKEIIYLETYVQESFGDLEKELNSTMNKMKCFMEEYWPNFSFSKKMDIIDEHIKSGSTKTIIYDPTTFK